LRYLPLAWFIMFQVWLLWILLKSCSSKKRKKSSAWHLSRQFLRIHKHGSPKKNSKTEFWYYISYSKRCRGHEAFSIHPSRHPSSPAEGILWLPILLLQQQSPSSSWERKPGDVDPGVAAEAVFNLLPWSAVCCYVTGHKQCKHQDFQQPHAECGI
jgi:hypothetical protein